MVWDKTLPVGTSKVSAGDNSIRANQDALETAVDLEHAFATGGTQTGRHTFDIDTIANRNSPGTAYENGGPFFATDERSGEYVLQVLVGGVWKNVDVNPDGGGSLPTLPRVNAQSKFTVAQHATWVEVTPSPGSPDTLAVDIADSPAKYATIVGDTIVSNPTNELASNTTTIMVELIMDGSGGHTITWGTNYRTPSGSTPGIATGAAERTMVYLSQMQNDKWLVTTSPNLIAII